MQQVFSISNWYSTHNHWDSSTSKSSNSSSSSAKATTRCGMKIRRNNFGCNNSSSKLNEATWSCKSKLKLKHHKNSGRRGRGADEAASCVETNLKLTCPMRLAFVWNEIDSQRLNCSNRLSIIDYRLSITGEVPDEGQSRGAEQHHYLFIIMNIDLHKR